VQKTRAQEQLTQNWVTIILAVLSIIQGLAFNNLVIQFPDIYQDWRVSHDLRVVIHFLLSFVLLLRIFQTYLTAALDYNPWVPNFFDIFIIFVVGALEYFLFSTLKVSAAFGIVQFHSRLSIIALFGIIGYLLAILRIQETLFPHYRDYVREVRLQIANILGVVVVLAVSLVIIFFPKMSGRKQILLATVSIVALISNVLLSLRMTFATRIDQATDTASLTVSDGRNIPAQNNRIDVFFKIPERENAAELTELFAENFVYFYSAMFDASSRLTKKILSRILLINRGKHPLGYKAFHVACEPTSGKIVGLCMLKVERSNRPFRSFVGTLGSALVLLLHLGVVGLIRTIQNIRQLGPLMPSIETGELRIVYIAVSQLAQRHGIGMQILEFAEGTARGLGKGLLSLEVREANMKARQFFRDAGFTEDTIFKCEGDRVLNQGNRIRMVKRLPP